MKKMNINQNRIEIKEVSNIAGLSSKEVSVISWLEFYQKYFFISKDIRFFFTNKRALYRTIEKLLKKKRIIKLNKNKYYLIPMKARTGKWSEHEFIMVDEIFNSGEYYIGGWTSANYWRLTDQIPSWIDVYSKNKQGKKILGNMKIIFHRIRKINKDKYTIKRIKGHDFKILNKRESKKWMKLRQYLL
jgi:predicted transcriptional regulator of viral defense system